MTRGVTGPTEGHQAHQRPKGHFTEAGVWGWVPSSSQVPPRHHLLPEAFPNSSPARTWVVHGCCFALPSSGSGSA